MVNLIPVGNKFSAVVDADLFESLNKYNWFPRQFRRCIYAATRLGSGGHSLLLNMHRLIARTPAGMVCHHINGNTLDNRRCNLINMSKKAHKLHHANNHIKKCFEHTNTLKTENQHNKIVANSIKDTNST